MKWGRVVAGLLCCGAVAAAGWYGMKAWRGLTETKEVAT